MTVDILLDMLKKIVMGMVVFGILHTLLRDEDNETHVEKDISEEEEND